MPLLLQFLEEFFHGELSLFCFSCVPVMSFLLVFLGWHPKWSFISRLEYHCLCIYWFRMWQNLPRYPFSCLIVICLIAGCLLPPYDLHMFSMFSPSCLFYHAHRINLTKTGINMDLWIGLLNNLCSLWVGKSSRSMSSNPHSIFHVQTLV